MASAMDSRLAYARLSAVVTASRLPTATRSSNNSYTTSWDTTTDDRGDGGPARSWKLMRSCRAKRAAQMDPPAPLTPS